MKLILKLVLLTQIELKLVSASNTTQNAALLPECASGQYLNSDESSCHACPENSTIDTPSQTGCVCNRTFYGAPGEAAAKPSSSSDKEKTCEKCPHTGKVIGVLSDSKKSTDISDCSCDVTEYGFYNVSGEKTGCTRCGKDSNGLYQLEVPGCVDAYFDDTSSSETYEKDCGLYAKHFASKENGESDCKCPSGTYNMNESIITQNGTQAVTCSACPDAAISLWPNYDDCVCRNAWYSEREETNNTGVLGRLLNCHSCPNNTVAWWDSKAVKTALFTLTGRPSNLDVPATAVEKYKVENEAKSRDVFYDLFHERTHSLKYSHVTYY